MGNSFLHYLHACDEKAIDIDSNSRIFQLPDNIYADRFIRNKKILV